MQRALVIGASGGIGGAVADALDLKGVEVSRLSRGPDGFDVTDQASVRQGVRALKAPFDLVFVATGILSPAGGAPEKALGQIDGAAMAHVMAVNAIGPALILAELPPLLPKEGRSVVAVLTARVGSIGDNHLGGWYAYRASKAAANQIVRTASIEIARRRKDAVVVALHPGTVETRFTAGYRGHRKVTAEEAAEKLIGVIETLDSSASGGFFDTSGTAIPW